MMATTERCALVGLMLCCMACTTHIGKRGRARSIGGVGVVDDMPEFHGYQGLRAILKIMIERRGICRDAYTLEDGTPVDIMWGRVTDAVRHRGYGLAHALDKHEWEIGNKLQMAHLIHRVITEGGVNLTRTDNRRRVLERSGLERVVLAVSDGIPRRSFVLTAYRID